jgi:predicted alpha/beta superfamily hydrolase
MATNTTELTTDTISLTAPAEPQVVPAERLRRHERFGSQFLEPRDLVVYCPPDYDQSGGLRYPVVYLHDGQNLFDPETAYIPGMHWQVGETADRLISEGTIDPLIIVGVHNAGERRIDEYTPTRDRKLGGGEADLYGRMLIEEVKAFIDSEYRTLSDPLNTAIGGSSLGGLVSLYLGLNRPDVFSKVIAMSPSVWWNKRSILKMIAATPVKPRLRVWLDIGSEEGDKAVKDAEALRDALITRGWQLGDDLAFCLAQGAAHNEAAWARRIGPALQFLFPREG